MKKFLAKSSVFVETEFFSLFFFLLRKLISVENKETNFRRRKKLNLLLVEVEKRLSRATFESKKVSCREAVLELRWPILSTLLLSLKSPMLDSNNNIEASFNFTNIAAIQ